ncbi:MAG: hypothetical protein J7M16_02880, partial [Anaerolineae bacterium]|nr:hypothetical protein [Anaerolineae bacterium]
ARRVRFLAPLPDELIGQQLSFSVNENNQLVVRGLGENGLAYVYNSETSQWELLREESIALPGIGLEIKRADDGRWLVYDTETGQEVGILKPDVTLEVGAGIVSGDRLTTLEGKKLMWAELDAEYVYQKMVKHAWGTVTMRWGPTHTEYQEEVPVGPMPISIRSGASLRIEKNAYNGFAWIDVTHLGAEKGQEQAGDVQVVAIGKEAWVTVYTPPETRGVAFKGITEFWFRDEGIWGEQGLWISAAGPRPADYPGADGGWRAMTTEELMLGKTLHISQPGEGSLLHQGTKMLLRWTRNPAKGEEIAAFDQFPFLHQDLGDGRVVVVGVRGE